MAAIPGFVQVNTDDFNRANETPLAGNWVLTLQGTNSFNLSTNTVVLQTTPSSDIYARYSPWTSGNDQYSQIAVTTTGNTGVDTGVGPVVRKSADTALTGYRLIMNETGNFQLDRVNAGTPTNLRTGSVTYVAGTLTGLSIIGATLKIWYAGVQVGADIVDGTPINSGIPGFGYSSTLTTATLDNWDAGAPGVGGGFRKNALKPWPFKPAFVRR